MKKILIILFCVPLLCSCGISESGKSEPLREADSPELHSLPNTPSESSPTAERENNTTPARPIKPTYNKITADEAYSIITSKESFILLDVRTDEEYNEIRIENAVLIPDFEINSRAETELTDKDALILIYCRSGRRSASAAQELADMGYTNIYDFGGIIDWPYETVSANTINN